METVTVTRASAHLYNGSFHPGEGFLALSLQGSKIPNRSGNLVSLRYCAITDHDMDRHWQLDQRQTLESRTSLGIDRRQCSKRQRAHYRSSCHNGQTTCPHSRTVRNGQVV